MQSRPEALSKFVTVCVPNQQKRGRQQKDGGGLGEDHEAEQESDRDEGSVAQVDGGEVRQAEGEQPRRQQEEHHRGLKYGETTEGVEKGVGD